MARWLGSSHPPLGANQERPMRRSLGHEAGDSLGGSMPALELAAGLQHRRATQREHSDAEDTGRVLGDGRDLSYLKDVVEEEEVHRKEAHYQPEIERSSHTAILARHLRGSSTSARHG